MIDRRYFLGTGLAALGIGAAPVVAERMTARLKQPPRSVLRHGEPMIERVFSFQKMDDPHTRKSKRVEYPLDFYFNKPCPSYVSVPLVPVCEEGDNFEEVVAAWHAELKGRAVEVLMVAAEQHMSFPEGSYEEQVQNCKDHFGHDDIGFFERDGWLIAVNMLISPKYCVIPVLDPPTVWSKGLREGGFACYANLGIAVLDQRVVVRGRLREIS